MTTRMFRTFALALTASVLLACVSVHATAAEPPAADTPAALPAGMLDITAFGAKGDGQTLNTTAIQNAIDKAASSGAGTVYIPPGRYLTGTIFLKSNVTLSLAKGATLLGSTRLEDYPSCRPEFRSYTDNYVHQSLIYGEKLSNIAIIGEGTIDGQGTRDNFDPSGPDHGYRRRPYLIRLVQCQSIRIQGITLRNSAMWVQHYLACDDLLVTGVTVRSTCNVNNDGLNLDCCHNVRVADCDIRSGDDAIVLKSTADRRCSNVTINNCILSTHCNGLKMGTETNGGFENVTITNCALYDINLAGVTLQLVDGGTLERVTISNITMNRVGTPIFIRLGDRARPYKKNMDKPGVGKLRRVILDNIIANNARQTAVITGIPDHRVEDLTLSNIKMRYNGGVSRSEIPENVPEREDSYPEHTMFGRLPASGLYCRHVRSLVLDNIQIETEKPDDRSAMIFEDVRDLRLSGVDAPGSSTAEATISLTDVHRALIRGCQANPLTRTFLQIDKQCRTISVIGNDLSQADQAIATPADWNERELFTANNRQ